MLKDIDAFRGGMFLLVLLALVTLSACAGPSGLRPDDRVQEWTLIFEGFSLEEMVTMERGLEMFIGYAGHRPGNGIKTNRHHEYWYRSSIISAKMEQNLHRLLKKFDYRGRIYMSGLKVEVRKDPDPIQARPSNSQGW